MICNTAYLLFTLKNNAMNPEYKKMAAKAYPIYTNIRKGPGGKVDCKMTVARKEYMRNLYIARLIKENAPT